MMVKGLLIKVLPDNGCKSANTSMGDIDELSKKRSSSDLEGGGSLTLPFNFNIASACRATNTIIASAGASSNQYGSLSAHSQCYDPAVPRTGCWTDADFSFRDVIIAHCRG